MNYKKCNADYKARILLAVAAVVVLTVTIMVIIFTVGSGNTSRDSNNASTSEANLQNLYYIKNNTIYYTSLEAIKPKELVPYPDYSNISRNILRLQVSEDGSHLF
jgi:flagellar basal body-associated protein FliL